MPLQFIVVTRLPVGREPLHMRQALIGLIFPATFDAKARPPVYTVSFNDALLVLRNVEPIAWEWWDRHHCQTDTITFQQGECRLVGEREIIHEWERERARH